MLAGLGYVAFALDMYGNGATITDPNKAEEPAGIKGVAYDM
jgi:dienelactone hydrolase